MNLLVKVRPAGNPSFVKSDVDDDWVSAGSPHHSVVSFFLTKHHGSVDTHDALEDGHLTNPSMTLLGTATVKL